MFHGSIPAAMRKYVAECVRSWETSDLYVGCSGNFTIERCLPEMRHHGNDVTLYSSAIGWWASGQDMPLSLKPESRPLLDWVEPCFEDRDETLALVMLATRFFDSVGRDNAYHRRQVQAYRDQWDRVLGGTVEKVRKSTLELASYHCKDVREWLADDVPADAPVAMFPPFFSGDYEGMFAPLEKHIEWPEPTYDLLDEAGKDAMVQQIIDRPQWMIGLHEPREELQPHLKGMVQTTNRGVPIYLYASEGSPRRMVAPSQGLEPVMVSRLGPDDELDGTEPITLSPLTGGQFATLRSQYMNHTIKPGSPLLAFAVCIGGKIAGCIAFGTVDSKFGPHMAYLLSDFPVVPTRYRRLAALMVRVAQSTECQHLLQRSLSRRIDSMQTTAYSNNPVSMKYRSGGMTLLTRKPGTDGHHDNTLQYGADAGRWTMQDAYAQWFKKHGTK